jgi:hypothetical protein
MCFEDGDDSDIPYGNPAKIVENMEKRELSRIRRGGMI